MANRTNHRRQGKRRSERPTHWGYCSGCSGEGHNGAIGRTRWKKLSRRKMRHSENNIEEEIKPHRKARLRSYQE